MASSLIRGRICELGRLRRERNTKTEARKSFIYQDLQHCKNLPCARGPLIRSCSETGRDDRDNIAAGGGTATPS